MSLTFPNHTETDIIYATMHLSVGQKVDNNKNMVLPLILQKS